MPKKRFSLLLTIFVVLFSTSMVFARPAEAGFWDTIKEKLGFTSAREPVNDIVTSLQAGADGTVSTGELIPRVNTHLMSDMYIRIAGVPPDMIAGMTPQQRKLVQKHYGKGAIGDLGTAIAYLYSPPATTQSYIADIMRSAKIIPSAQAQGIGFSALDPILETWKTFRNVAYLFFVLVFVIIGFMIMFRQKIGGQTVVTAQQAIPSIIIALIFVTFSYAIAGVMIDLMYLLMYLLIGVFRPAGGLDLIDTNFLSLGVRLITGQGQAFDSVNLAVQSFVEQVADFGALSTIIEWISGITMALIVSLAILIGVFKIFFELLKTYITIIIAIALSPIILMLGAIPGKNTFGPWIKTLTANLLAFPVVLICLILFSMFSGNSFDSGGFMPPYLVGMGSGSAGIITTLAGMGIILIIPEIIKEMKKAMGASGGVFETLGNAMVKNAAAGEPAIPVATSVVGGAAGVPRAAFSAWGRQKPTEFIKRSLLHGYKGSDGRIHGGLLRGAKSGYGFGKTVRKVVDRAKEGRLLDPEDATTMIAQALSRRPDAEADKKKSTEREKVDDPI